MGASVEYKCINKVSPFCASHLDSPTILNVGNVAKLRLTGRGSLYNTSTDAAEVLFYFAAVLAYCVLTYSRFRLLFVCRHYIVDS